MASLKKLDKHIQKLSNHNKKELFSKKLIVDEKISGHRLWFIKHSYGVIEILKSNNFPLNNIDRILSVIYEDVVEYMLGKLNEIAVEPNTSVRFGIEFVSKINDNYFDTKPINNIVLTDWTLYRSETDSYHNNYNIDQLNNFSEHLNVSPPPIIFMGMLNTKKDKFIQLLESGDSDIIDYYKLLSPDSSKPLYKDNFDKPIESLVFRFLNEDNTTYNLFKIANDKFPISEKGEPDETYSILLMEMTNFIDSTAFNYIDLNSIDSQYDRYIEIINILFKAYIDKIGNKYESVEFNYPDFIDLDINYNLITDAELISILEKSDKYVYLYKIMLTSFRRKKKNSYNILTHDFILKFNKLVESIEKSISQ